VQRRFLKEERCSQRRIRSDALDELVWEEVSTRLQDPELVLEAYREGRTHRVDRDESGSNEQAQKLATQIKLANTEMTRLLDAYQVGAIELSDLQKRRRLVESKLDTLNREKELLEKIAAEQRHEGDARGELQEFAALVSSHLLLIRLFQLTRGGNMSGCLAQLFQKPYGSFNRGLPPKKPVSNTSPNAAGRMASCVRDVENAERIS